MPQTPTIAVLSARPLTSLTLVLTFSAHKMGLFSIFIAFCCNLELWAVCPLIPLAFSTTWTENFFQAQTASYGYSLMDIRFSNSTYLWAAGAVLGSSIASRSWWFLGDLINYVSGNVPSAWFLRSDDGGQTWAQGSDLIFGLYAMALSSPSTQTSYAAGLPKRALVEMFPSFFFLSFQLTTRSCRVSCVCVCVW